MQGRKVKHREHGERREGTEKNPGGKEAEKQGGKEKEPAKSTAETGLWQADAEKSDDVL